VSINFDDSMGHDAERKIREMFSVVDIDEKIALLKNMEQGFSQRQMGDLARAAKQQVTVEINSLGDRKTVGGVAYELRAAGWYRLPIGTIA